MVNHDWLRDIPKLLTGQFVVNLMVAVLIMLVGVFLARRSKSAVDRITHLDNQQRTLLTKVAYYGLLFAAIAAALGQLGVDVKVLLGAAGVLTVAVGFAAQTSASNLISGLFLMLERPFSVGDVIQLGDMMGEVLSVDLLSSRIRTFNNVMVRIPNETLVKSNITNLSYFKVRRFDLNFVLAFGTDLNLAEKLMRDVATKHPSCLADPPPIFINKGFSDLGMITTIQCYALTQQMQRVQNELYRDIKIAFDQADVSLGMNPAIVLKPRPTATPAQ